MLNKVLGIIEIDKTRRCKNATNRLGPVHGRKFPVRVADPAVFSAQGEGGKARFSINSLSEDP